jgi:hypothetical protein
MQLLFQHLFQNLVQVGGRLGQQRFLLQVR